MTLAINDPRRPNAIDPETRAEMAVLGQYPGEHWIHTYNALVATAQTAPVVTSTLMSHLSHAEIRTLLAFLVGHDAAASA
jgi:hypothetical protein